MTGPAENSEFVSLSFSLGNIVGKQNSRAVVSMRQDVAITSS